MNGYLFGINKTLNWRFLAFDISILWLLLVLGIGSQEWIRLLYPGRVLTVRSLSVLTKVLLCPSPISSFSAFHSAPVVTTGKQSTLVTTTAAPTGAELNMSSTTSSTGWEWWILAWIYRPLKFVELLFNQCSPYVDYLLATFLVPLIVIKRW